MPPKSRTVKPPRPAANTGRMNRTSKRPVTETNFRNSISTGEIESDDDNDGLCLHGMLNNLLLTI